MSKHFRFEDLKIWQKAVSIANRLFKISVELEKKGFYRYAEQIRASGLSICNNIAELEELSRMITGFQGAWDRSPNILLAPCSLLLFNP